MSAPTFNWEFLARPERAVDGDTYDLTVDLGYDIAIGRRFRHSEFDTYEIFGVEKDSESYQKGMEQKRAVEQFFDACEGDWPLVIRTKQDTGKFGRYLVSEMYRHEDDVVLASRIPHLSD